MIYVDLRVRNESLDIGLIASQLDAGGVAAPVPASGATEPPLPASASHPEVTYRRRGGARDDVYLGDGFREGSGADRQTG